MKVATMIARDLLGIEFLVFGLNAFLHFLPMGPAPSGPAGQFVGALISTHYMSVVSALQILAGVLLLAGWYVPLALTVLGPIIVNILLFHLLMAPAGLPLALLVVVLWTLTAYAYRSHFAGLLTQRNEDQGQKAF